MSTAGSNKLRMLYIMEELLEKSDETNKISTKMFTEMLEETASVPSAKHRQRHQGPQRMGDGYRIFQGKSRRLLRMFPRI